MVLYSTFLTRSGILGDTSVHAFTDLGMTGQLVIYLFAFLIPSLILLFYRYRDMPSQDKEEELLSREFWMFIGALVLLFSAVQQIFTTSIPVWNILIRDWLHLTDKKIAPPSDVIAHYNSIQVWLAILAGFGTAIIQYLAYKSNRVPSTIRWAWYSLALALLLSIGIAYGMDVSFLIDTAVRDHHFKFISPYYLMLLAGMYAVVANLAYLLAVLRGNIKLAGGSVAHFGFGVFLVGVLLSQYKKEVISLNTAGVNYGKEFSSKDIAENILLMRDSVYKMGDYEVSYRGFKLDKPNNLYEVHYIRRNKDGSIAEQFSLFPNAQINPKMGMVANPDTKHYLTKDIFTHVSSVPDNTKLKDKTTEYQAGVGDTFYTRKNYIIFRSMNPRPTIPDGYDMKGKVAVAAKLDINSLDGKSIQAEPIYVINLQDNSVSTAAYENEQLAMSINIGKINPETKKFTFVVTEKDLASDFVIMKAIIFPYIKLVWLGGIITFLGVFLSLYRRFGENKAQVG
jgi:cytochrome c-type biogenesis protein CcmF